MCVSGNFRRYVTVFIVTFLDQGELCIPRRNSELFHNTNINLYQRICIIKHWESNGELSKRDISVEKLDNI